MLPLFVVTFLSASAVIYGTPWAASASKPQCNNRIDDDGDGKIDYPSDPGCTGRGDKSELDPVGPPPPPPPGDVTLEPVDGGPNYYAQFTNPLPADKFPIAVWLDCLDDQGRVDSMKNAGVNLFLGVCYDPSGAAIQRVRNAGLKMVAQDEWVPEKNLLGVETSGWMGLDEIDMQRDPAQGCAELLAAKNDRADDNPTGTFFYNNFGKGVLFWETDTEAQCYVAIPHVVSSDAYWFNDSFVCGPAEGGSEPGVIKTNNCEVAANYGWQTNRLRSLVSPAGSKPVATFVELGCCIHLNEIRAAVWHTVIAGARAVLYFQHSFEPGAGNGACGPSPNVIRDCLPVRSLVIGINAQIQLLKSALDGPKLTSGFSASGGVRAVAKWDGSKFYVLAGAVPGAANETFSIPCVGNATAAVVGESRSVPVVAGAFTDTFDNANSVHIYRIDGGSTCGLT